MTLRALRVLHPELFHPTQDWFEGEAFMDAPLPLDAHRSPPTSAPFVSPSLLTPAITLPTALELALLYVEEPTHPIWRRYLWTDDTDRQGQRVYVGDNGRGLEIHRHLHLTDRWGVPVW